MDREAGDLAPLKVLPMKLNDTGRGRTLKGKPTGGASHRGQAEREDNSDRRTDTQRTYLRNRAQTGTLPVHLLTETKNEQKIEPGRCDSRRRTAVPHWRTDRTMSSCGNEELNGKIKAWRRVYRVEGKFDLVEQKPNEKW
jgi:hypothetical protein